VARIFIVSPPEKWLENYSSKGSASASQVKPPDKGVATQVNIQLKSMGCGVKWPGRYFLGYFYP
jgi:hypothetical protein